MVCYYKGKGNDYSKINAITFINNVMFMKCSETDVDQPTIVGNNGMEHSTAIIMHIFTYSRLVGFLYTTDVDHILGWLVLFYSRLYGVLCSTSNPTRIALRCATSVWPWLGRPYV